MIKLPQLKSQKKPHNSKPTIINFSNTNQKLESSDREGEFSKEANGFTSKRSKKCVVFFGKKRVGGFIDEDAFVITIRMVYCNFSFRIQETCKYPCLTNSSWQHINKS